MSADLLIKGALAWDALRRHAGAAEGSAESRRIAEDVMGILRQANVPGDRNRDSNRDRGHQRTTAARSARDQR